MVGQAMGLLSTILQLKTGPALLLGGLLVGGAFVAADYTYVTTRDYISSQNNTVIIGMGDACERKPSSFTFFTSVNKRRRVGTVTVENISDCGQNYHVITGKFVDHELTNEESVCYGEFEAWASDRDALVRFKVKYNPTISKDCQTDGTKSQLGVYRKVSLWGKLKFKLQGLLDV